MSEQSGFQISGGAAELYERYAVPYMMGPWALELVELAALRRGERVLDLARASLRVIVKGQTRLSDKASLRVRLDYPTMN